MESDGEELDYDFDTPQKPRVSDSRLTASADKNRGQKPRGEGTAAAKGAVDANVIDDGERAKKKPSDVDQDVEEELYGDIVSPGGACAGGGGGAALLTLQVAEVRTVKGGEEGRKSADDSIKCSPDLEKKLDLD